MKILITEDENDIREALEFFFRNNGYEVDTAENGRIALEKTRESAYDAIVMDVMMPEMDGIEALSLMRAEHNTTPVIMLTAKSELDDKLTGLDSGADDYLTKPFALKELLARVRSLTRRKEQYAPRTLKLGNVSLEPEDGILSAVNTISLASRETGIMVLMMNNPGRSFSESSLLEKVWADEKDVLPGTVDMYINFTNSKLSSIGADISVEKDGEGCYLLKEK